MDGEYVWEYCEDGQWIEAWWGYEPPSAADLEGLTPVELLELSGVIVPDKKPTSSSTGRTSTTGDATPNQLQLKWHTSAKNCIVATIDRGKTGEKKTYSKRFYVKRGADVHTACQVIANGIERDLGEPVQWRMPNEPTSPVKATQKPKKSGHKVWLAVIVSVILLAMCSSYKPSSRYSSSRSGYGTRSSYSSVSATSTKTESIGYQDAKKQYDRDVRSYGDNEYKESYTAALSGLQKLDKKASDQDTTSSVSSASIEEAKTAVDNARLAYVSEGEWLQEKREAEEAERRRQEEEQRRIEAEQAEQERIASIEASYVEPDVFHESFYDIYSESDLSIALSKQLLADHDVYGWDDYYQAYWDAHLEYVKTDTAYMRGMASQEDVYAAIDRMAEARRTMVIQYEIANGSGE